MNIEKEHFEAWLMQLPAGRCFDFMHSTSCLIASFLRETTRHRSAIVRRRDYNLEPAKSCVRVRFPDWLQAFSDKISSQIPMRPGYHQPFLAADSVFLWRELFPETPAAAVSVSTPDCRRRQPEITAIQLNLQLAATFY